MPDIDVAQDVTSQFELPAFRIKTELQPKLDSPQDIFLKTHEKHSNRKDTTLMTANKMYDLEKPDDRARKLASQLSLEEQVSLQFPVIS
jgi:hypothetical protein